MSQKPILVCALVMFLAGCLGYGGASFDALPHPSELEAPAWSLGDSWRFASVSGQWLNWTVEAIEPRYGFDTYKVRIELARPDLVGVRHYTYWLDRPTLGYVAFEQGSDYGHVDNPVPQLFPMINRTYSSTSYVEFSGDSYEIEQSLVFTVSGWESVQTPAGTFDAIWVSTVDEYTDQVLRPGFYSPHVGNYVAYVWNDEEFKLASWHRQT